MKRLSLLAAGVLLHIYAFAQRGRVRPEWDLNGHTGSRHNIDDDFYSFLLFVGLIVLFFVFLAIRGAISSSQAAKKKTNHSSFGEAYDKLEDGCGIVFGNGCLISMVIGIIVFPILLIIDSVNDLKPKEKTEQRKEKTLVNVLYSDTDYNQSHIASKDEFVEKDTVFYYYDRVYRNNTGKTLAMYSVEYSIKGTKTLEIIKTIPPNTYFHTGLLYITPFKKPPPSVNIIVSNGHSRWARSQRSNATRKEYFLDYLENVHQ